MGFRTLTGSSKAGWIVGAASAAAGALLLVLWVQQRFAPSMLSLPPAPFFDRLAGWDRGPLALACGLAGVALLFTGLAILRRMRFAPVLFAVCGWGGFCFTVAALWPGDTIHFVLQLALFNARRQGFVPPDAGVLSLVPVPYRLAALLFAALWLALLATGTAHLYRNRAGYNR